MTQDEVGTGLGISKQAVSKLEQSESIEDDRLGTNCKSVRCHKRWVGQL